MYIAVVIMLSNAIQKLKHMQFFWICVDQDF